MRLDVGSVWLPPRLASPDGSLARGKQALLLRSRGFSLVEVLVALAILAGSLLAMILTFRQGGIKQQMFTSEHFTAMFIAQKVLEDLNHQLKENPHSFSRLVRTASSMGDQKVVEGESEFFRLLESTRNFSQLLAAEDDPITKDSGHLYDQLSRFTVRVETRLVPNPETPGQSFSNLIDVGVIVKWHDKSGRAEELRIEQMMTGINGDLLKTGFTVNLQPLSESEAAGALWRLVAPDQVPTAPTIANFQAFNGGGDPTILRALGHALWVEEASAALASTSELIIDALTTERNQLVTSAQSTDRAKAVERHETVINEMERFTSTLFIWFYRLDPDLEDLARLEPNEAHLGTKLTAICDTTLLDRLGLLQASHKSILDSFLTMDGCFQQLFDPPLRPNVPERRMTELVRRWFDLRKLCTLYVDGSLGDSQSILSDTQKFIRALQTSFHGTQPVFEQYLAHEAQLNASLGSLKTELAALDRVVETVASINVLNEDTSDNLAWKEKVNTRWKRK
jgi:prepilin-type N-terminal cleavage/methylation domain-containing protein